MEVSEMPTPWWNDDDRLLEAVGEADLAARAVPPEFVRAGKALFTWREVNAELAALTYDSALDDDLASTIRGAQHAPLRALIFAGPELTIELEVAAEALVGQLDPPRAGTAETLLATGDVVATPIDETGYFVFRPPPDGDFRLRCRPATGTGMVTGWIRL
jgi:hypothetical protein